MNERERIGKCHRWTLLACTHDRARVLDVQVYTQAGATRSTQEWLRDIYPRIRKEAAAGNADVRLPLECTQHAGQMIYVPEGWWHATVNVVETMGVARQLIPNAKGDSPGRSSPIYWRQAAQQGRGNTTLIGGLQESLKLLPTDADTLADLADAHLRVGEFDHAEKAAERCITANPTTGRGPEMLMTVAVVLLQEVQQYDPHLFTPSSNLVKSWLKVGERARGLLERLPIPHTLDDDGWVLRAFGKIKQDLHQPHPNPNAAEDSSDV